MQNMVRQKPLLQVAGPLSGLRPWQAIRQIRSGCDGTLLFQISERRIHPNRPYSRPLYQPEDYLEIVKGKAQQDHLLRDAKEQD